MNDGEISIEGGATASTLESEPEGIVLNPHAQVCLQQLLRVWLGFERDLSKVPLLRRIDLGTYTAEDHQIFLRNISNMTIKNKIEKGINFMLLQTLPQNILKVKTS